MFGESQKIGLYTLIRKLGEGGFGEVWLAENLNHSPSEKVAIKLPRKDQIDLQAVKDEIFNWILSGRHKNILPIIECETFGNQIAIVSEYAPDGSLQNLLKKHGLFSVADAVEITVGILDGLAHLHNRKIIHRDLKPDNVLFQGRTPRLTDFGISRAMTVSSQSQTVSGTFSYMAPEAFDGKRNAQTDIWAVGVILYQLLTGNLPFPQKEKVELIGALVMKEPVPLSDAMPDEIKEIIFKTLEKSSENRYKSAGEMCKALQNFQLILAEAERKERQKRIELSKRLEVANEKAKRLGILPINIKADEKSVKEFETTVKLIENEVSKTELLKTKLLKKYKTVEKRAVDLGISLPDNIVLTKVLVQDMESLIAITEKNIIEKDKPKSKTKFLTIYKKLFIEYLKIIAILQGIISVLFIIIPLTITGGISEGLSGLAIGFLSGFVITLILFTLSVAFIAICTFIYTAPSTGIYGDLEHEIRFNEMTRDEADQIGEALIKVNFFNEKERKSVNVTKTENTYHITYYYSRNAENLKDTLESSEKLQKDMQKFFPDNKISCVFAEYPKSL